MSIGSLYTSDIRSKDILRCVGTVVMVKETRQGSVNHCYCYKSNDSGYYDRVFEGTMTECSIYMDNL